MAPRYKTSIDLSGPFFEKDPAKTFRQNVRVMLAALAEEGEEDVKGALRLGQFGRAPISAGVTPARVADHVKGRVRSLKGKPWAMNAVVSVNNSGLSQRQGKALMAAASKLEGQTHAFRRTTSRLKRSRKINERELLKGLG